jgi:hypothetical protein
VTAMVASLCTLGYGLMVPAALQLGSKRRYVRTAAPEGGGIGYACRAWQSSGMSEQWLRVFVSFESV